MPVRKPLPPTRFRLVIYYGIDPGVSGGIAATSVETNLDNGASVKGPIITCAMPGSDLDLLGCLENSRQFFIDGANESGYKHLKITEMAVLEQVSGYIGHKHPGSAMFKFGASYGALRMALAARGICHEIVNPLVWQRAMGVGNPKRTKKDKDEKIPPAKAATKKDHKNKLKAKAQQLFPDTKVTNSTADALLLMEYGMRFVFNRAFAY